MRTIRTKKWLKACILLSLTAMSVSGCVFRITDQPTPTPLPTTTSTASPTPPPTPTLTPTLTPAPTLTQIPVATPAHRCAISWRWTNNSLLIDTVGLSRADGLMHDDEVVTINGRLALEVILEAEEEIIDIDNPEERRAKALHEILVENELLVLLLRHQSDPPYFFNLHTGCKQLPTGD